MAQTDEVEELVLKMVRSVVDTLLVKRAGLNCGNCSTCISNQECEKWFLHKFRASFITTLLRNGMDLRSVMSLSGHADLASVMRYLRPAEGQAVQDKVNSIKWR
jgi:integrase